MPRPARPCWPTPPRPPTPGGRPRPLLPGLPTGPVANAAEALERAAVAAETRPATTPRPNQWIYTESRTTSSASGSQVHRAWRRVDGKQWAYIENGKLRISTRERRAPGVVWDYSRMSRLPTTPDALLRWATEQAARHVQTEPGEIYNLFNAILRNGGVLPPRLEAAIFRAMKQLHGVTLLSLDLAGHRVYSLGLVQQRWLHEELLLDRRTIAYRGERSKVLTDDNPKDPSLKKGTTIVGIRLAAAIVDQAGQRP